MRTQDSLNKTLMILAFILLYKRLQRYAQNIQLQKSDINLY